MYAFARSRDTRTQYLVLWRQVRFAGGGIVESYAEIVAAAGGTIVVGNQIVGGIRSLLARRRGRRSRDLRSDRATCRCCAVRALDPTPVCSTSSAHPALWVSPDDADRQAWRVVRSKRSKPPTLRVGGCCRAGGSDGRDHVRVDHDADGRVVERARRHVAVALIEGCEVVRHGAVSGTDGGVVREAARRRGAVGVGVLWNASGQKLVDHTRQRRRADR